MNLDSIDIFECIQLDIDDNLLKDAEIASYMCNQELPDMQGNAEPYAPKKFPDKAIVILVPLKTSENADFAMSGDVDEIEIYLDAEELVWDSRFVINGHFGKLSPEQMSQFFNTQFFVKLLKTLDSKWPLSDPKYAELFKAAYAKNIREILTQSDLDEIEECESKLNEVDQAGKRVDLANKDTTGDGKRDYSGSGRKIIHFGDMGVKGNSGEYFCWPRTGKEFKWNTWKDWTKLKPFARMGFVYNGRKYMISLSLYDEGLENRGFRGADLTWTPPLAWLTPDECTEVMKLSIVRRFLSKCLKVVKPYLDLTPSEVLNLIDKPERVNVKEIEKTQRVIRHVLSQVIKKNQADNYRYN